MCLTPAIYQLCGLEAHLDPAFHQIQRYQCRVRESAAQDSSKPADGVVLGRAKLAAILVAWGREGR